MYFPRHYAGEFIVIVKSFWPKLCIKILCNAMLNSPGGVPHYFRKFPRIFAENPKNFLRDFQQFPRNSIDPRGTPIIFPYTPHPPPYPRFYPLPYPHAYPNFNPVFLQFTFFIQGYMFIPPDSSTSIYIFESSPQQHTRTSLLTRRVSAALWCTMYMFSIMCKSIGSSGIVMVSTASVSDDLGQL